jgi:hypothetical protein
MFVNCTDHFLDDDSSNAGSFQLLRKDVFLDGFNFSSTKAVRGIACWSARRVAQCYAVVWGTGGGRGDVHTACATYGSPCVQWSL